MCKGHACNFFMHRYPYQQSSLSASWAVLAHPLIYLISSHHCSRRQQEAIYFVDIIYTGFLALLHSQGPRYRAYLYYMHMIS
ncbi:hypothetical protein GDO86_012793 [Hymenochirus boettgeri]|uniref:Uncharacterized protein n=1 Tax=Hymenochirus boettgeri TaxID=247094 RepID=A0A8T2INQ3_9PIPI|nr:hypothetical protein GDO86_012793 [Hymenochirus boettgeri]